MTSSPISRPRWAEALSGVMPAPRLAGGGHPVTTAFVRLRGRMPTSSVATGLSVRRMNPAALGRDDTEQTVGV
jgi:hypothetical protein